MKSNVAVWIIAVCCVIGLAGGIGIVVWEAHAAKKFDEYVKRRADFRWSLDASVPGNKPVKRIREYEQEVRDEGNPYSLFR